MKLLQFYKKVHMLTNYRKQYLVLYISKEVQILYSRTAEQYN
jgi:hypothetical protein